MNATTRGIFFTLCLSSAVACWSAPDHDEYTPRYQRVVAPNIRGAVAPLGIGSVERTPARSYNRKATTEALKPKKKFNNQVKLAGVNDTVLVLYDSTGIYNWIGDLYSQHMANLLTHFNVTVNRMPVEQYQAGAMQAAKATFYLGVLYDNPLPVAFTNDAMTTTKPLCWMGYNLWKIAWTPSFSWNSSFTNRFGMAFYYIDSLGYPTVNYKGQDLTKLQLQTAQGRVEVTNPAIAKRVATSTRPDGLNIGYITKGANLYYVADNPFAYTSYAKHNDRVLAFEDTIHDILGTDAVEDHRAVVRIEDVSPRSNPGNLRAIADTLFAEGVPFMVCVIPSQRDPLGVENNGVPASQDMTANPAFLSALKYMESKGGQIVMHGWTHQYSNVANPYTAQSALDYEFFRVAPNSNGGSTFIGPVNEDSSAWASNRLQSGLNLLSQGGFPSVPGWVTPHYLASPVDYIEIAKKFSFSACRGVNFTQNSLGDLIYVQQHSPWVITDGFGIKRIPETIGYIEFPTPGVVTRTAQDVINDAAANYVVRDGIAGMFFHWFLDPAELRKAVQGIKALGYRYVMPSASMN